MNPESHDFFLPIFILFFILQYDFFLIKIKAELSRIKMPVRLIILPKSHWELLIKQQRKYHFFGEKNVQ